MKRQRIRDFGIIPGRLPTGTLNKITDVSGVRVGHVTIHDGANHTGLTLIVPGPGNAFTDKFIAASYVHNGFGKTCGLVQIDELGTLETPIALTNTLNVGLVADGLIEQVLRQCSEENVEALSVNPVVGECNDSRINDIQHRAVQPGQIAMALESANTDFEEGDVGAGTGTVCYGLKGGIGSASRILSVDGTSYTIGALVQSNFGATEDLVINTIPAGPRILEERDRWEKAAISEQDQGSIMTIIATDLPVSNRQLRRIIRRAGVGIARTGAYTGHGSGEVMIGFSTANRVKANPAQGITTMQVLREDLLNQAFLAAAEAVQEAILNSLASACQATGRHGEIYYSLSEFLPAISQWDLKTGTKL